MLIDQAEVQDASSEEVPLLRKQSDTHRAYESKGQRSHVYAFLGLLGIQLAYTYQLVFRNIWF